MRYIAPGRRAVHGLLAVTVTTALTTGLLPHVAAAAPADEPPAAGAADEPLLPEATTKEKHLAAVVVNAGFDDDLLAKADRDFVFGIYDRAGDRDADVKAAALAAYRDGSVEAATLFIRTGIFEAHERDNAARVERQLAREAKRRVWAALGVEPTPVQMAADDRNFVLEVQRHALARRTDGFSAFPKVAAAADAVLTADKPAEYKQFIDVDVFALAKQDQLDVNARDKDRTEADLAEQRRRDAIMRATAVLGIVATESILVLDNQNVVRHIASHAIVGTEVDAKAEDALHSPDPAVWKNFIEVEIFAANQRDIENERRKQAAADREQAGIIRAAAENSLVHPRLAAAAAAALAGTDRQVGEFVRKGQYEYAEQTLQTTNATWQGWYIPNKAGVVSVVPEVTAGQANWKIVRGLADAACHSLESTTRPGYFLREAASAAKVAANDGSDAFKTAATWCVKKSGSGVSFELKGQPGTLLRHRGTDLWVTPKGTARQMEDPCGWTADTTWQVGGLETPAADPAKAEDPCAPIITYPGQPQLVRQQVRDHSLVSYKIVDKKNRTAAEKFTVPGWVRSPEMGSGSFGRLLQRTPRIVAVEQSTGKLWMYQPGDSRQLLNGSNWNGMRELVVGNFAYEESPVLEALAGVEDVLVVERSTGKLWLYAGTDDGDTYKLKARVELRSSGWNGMDNLIAGFYNDDAYTDLVAVERSTGKLWLYPGAKDDKLGARIEIGAAGWNAFSQLVAGNFVGDAEQDIVAVDASGTKWFAYPGKKDGTLGTRVELTLK